MIRFLIQSIKDALEKYPLQDPLLGLFLWQWVALGTILFLGGAAVMVFLGRIHTILPRSQAALIKQSKIRQRAILLTVTGLILYTVPHLELDPHATMLSSTIWALHLLTILFIFLLVNDAANLCAALLLKSASQKESHYLDLLRFVTNFSKIIAFVLTALLVPRFLVSYDLGSLLTKLSIGAGTLTAIVALASKDLISNFFGALVIILGRPFKIGDWIVVDKFQGRVVSIHMRSTKLHLPNGSFIYVPNANFTNKYVKNYGNVLYAPITMAFHIHKISSEKINAFLGNIETLLATYPELIKNRSHFELNSIDKEKVALTFHFSFRQMEEKTKVNHLHTLIQELHKTAATLGIAAN